MHHAERPGGPVAAAQKCATHGPLSVAMSQKSSAIQYPQSVSQALTGDTRRRALSSRYRHAGRR